MVPPSSFSWRNAISEGVNLTGGEEGSASAGGRVELLLEVVAELLLELLADANGRSSGGEGSNSTASSTITLWIVPIYIFN